MTAPLPWVALGMVWLLSGCFRSNASDTPPSDAGQDTAPACQSHSECTEANASRCELDAGDCVACENDKECTHISQKPYCEQGSCVACRIATEATDCDGTFCDETTHTCTEQVSGTKDTCEACSTDSECAPNRRCVEHTFDASAVGTYCFLHASVGCGDTVVERRPYRTKLEATSIDGVTGEYCMPPVSTTCKGIADTQSVSCDDNTDCGEPGLDDGYCPTVGTGAGSCSYLCGGNFDCSATLSCGGSPAHCKP